GNTRRIFKEESDKQGKIIHMLVLVITLLSSGISSSVIGTLAGQAVMEGLLGTKVNIWIRRIVTRFVNVIPTTIGRKYLPLFYLLRVVFRDAI
ncbi:MAG: divalent metal cation transporter, partial [Candidatus Nitrosopolaris sp.]